MRGFWQAMQQGDPRAMSAIDPNDQKLHYPDYWKTPLHKTFSNESQWAPANAPKWTEDDKLVTPGGRVVFDDKAKNGSPYSSPLLAEWTKKAAGNQHHTAFDMRQQRLARQGLKPDFGSQTTDLPTLMAKQAATGLVTLPQRLGEAVQESNAHTFGPGPSTMTTDELPFSMRDRSPGLAAEAAMTTMGGAGIVPAEANALRTGLTGVKATSKAFLDQSVPVDIWATDASKLIPGQLVTAGPGGPVGTFKGISPGGSTVIDWKAKTVATPDSGPKTAFKQAASNAVEKFGKDKAVANQKYWNQVKQPAVKPGSEEATTDLWSKLREPTPVEKEITTEEAMSAIEKALKEPWTGESKSMEYPSSNHKVSTSHSEYFNDLGEFPQVVPFRPPEKAVSQGYVTPAVHGTVLGESRWTPSAGGELGGRGDALRLPYQELGVHFGTPDQARHFTGNELRESAAPRTYPVVLQTGKSLELPDMGNWNIDLIKDGLKRLDRGSGYGVDAGYFKVADPQGHLGEFPASEMDKINSIKEMRGYLHSKGYDSINYINKVEGPGQRSYIMFKPSPDEPDFVSGVRSPFAGFDPSKILRPDIAAGVTGIAGAATMAPSESKAKTAPTKGGQDQSSPTLSPGVVKFIMEFLKANPDLAQEMSTRMQDVINGKQIQGQQPPQGPVNGP